MATETKEPVTAKRRKVASGWVTLASLRARAQRQLVARLADADAPPVADVIGALVRELVPTSAFALAKLAYENPDLFKQNVLVRTDGEVHLSPFELVKSAVENDVRLSLVEKARAIGVSDDVLPNWRSVLEKA